MGTMLVLSCTSTSTLGPIPATSGSGKWRRNLDTNLRRTLPGLPRTNSLTPHTHPVGGARQTSDEFPRPDPRGLAAMAEVLLSQVYSAGKKVIEMVETAKECVDEGKEIAARFVVS